MVATAEVGASSAAGSGWLQWPTIRISLHSLSHSARRHMPLTLQARRSHHHCTSL
jgi:hypothetical protein